MGALAAAAVPSLWVGLRQGVEREAIPDPPSRHDSGRSRAVAVPEVLPRIMGVRKTIPHEAMELGKSLANHDLAVSERRKAAFALGLIGTEEAFRLLWSAFDGAPLELKTAILEATGQCRLAAAEAVLRDYAKGNEQSLTRAALRGLASLQPNSIIGDFAAIMDDPELPISLRSEAALCLGELDNPASTQVLLNALGKNVGAGDEAETLAEFIMEALASRPEKQVRDAFAALLELPDIGPDFRATVLESMGQIEGDVSDLVLPHLGSGEQIVRAAAAWALATSPERGNHAAGVLNALRTEGSSEVRAALYGAAGNQSAFPVETLVSLVGAESDPHAQVEGLRAISGMMGFPAVPNVGQWFDETGVPMARFIALGGQTDAHDRMLAVMALAQAKTAASRQALEDIASSSNASPSVKQAATAAMEH